MLHVQVSLGSPFLRRNISQSSAYKHQCRFAIRKTAHDPRPSAYLPVQAFKDVVRPYATPAFLAFACALACSEYLPVAVFGHPYRDKYRDAGYFAAPAALQVDAVNEYVSSPTGAP